MIIVFLCQNSHMPVLVGNSGGLRIDGGIHQLVYGLPNQCLNFFSAKRNAYEVHLLNGKI